MINKYLPVSDLKLGQMVEVDWDGSRVEARIIGLELIENYGSDPEVVVTVTRGRETQQVREGEIYTPKKEALNPGDKEVVMVEVHAVKRHKLGLGSNLFASVTIDGIKVKAMRQGSLGIWAFPGRPSYSADAQKYIDGKLDHETYVLGVK